MTPQLISKSLSKLLERHPHLKRPIEQGRFLTGYTQGGHSGNQIHVFLIRSPWTQFCLDATAIGILPAGAVLLITEEAKFTPQSLWKAYTLESDNKSAKSNKNSYLNGVTLSSVSKSLTSTATSIAIESERKYSSRRIREISQQQLVR